MRRFATWEVYVRILGVTRELSEFRHRSLNGEDKSRLVPTSDHTIVENNV